MEVSGVKVWSPVYPVLIGKENNPVLRVQIDAVGSKKAVALEGLTLDLEGTDQLGDIQEVRAFFTGASSDFSVRRAFGESQDGTIDPHFTGSQLLQPGSNYLWISFELESTADISRKLKVQLSEITVDGKKMQATQATGSPTKRMGHALRQHRQDDIHTYRIPGMVTTNEGTLIAVYDNRHDSSTDLQGDIDVGMSRSTDGGQTWEPMRVIMDMGEWGGKPEDQNGIGDPCILVDRQTGTIWVAGLWIHGHPGARAWNASQPGISPEETGQFMLVKSEDDGRTWSAPVNITEQIKRPEWQLLLEGPGMGITMKNGTLVFPAQFKDGNQIPHATIVYSTDRGESWQIGTGAKSQTTEAQLVELADGSLMLNMRDDRGNSPGGRNGLGARSVMITKDMGQTWTEHPTSREALPEPVCMASLVRHQTPSEEVLLFSNPLHRYVRKNMTIQLSRDEGQTWPREHHLLLDEGQGNGYSCISSIDENTIGIIYEGSQADLIFQRVDLAELE
ncbi:sialidase [Flavilitoribacter nigricans DSM 23189 = NBRC 102662]|uniref:exo-alpha-sialidase n=2 Tax=Flavilitoribacter TaxID=2762562 RepID=A0A2D0N9F3_FLAN2|nr:sialidase [Flavilitoribacter nigricans DSM 23189 = NBRC 102662]